MRKMIQKGSVPFCTVLVKKGAFGLPDALFCVVLHDYEGLILFYNGPQPGSPGCCAREI